MVAEEQLERGSDDFVVELRRIHESDQLGSFAPIWFNDRRAASRRLLLRYLEMPFNCYRHESLVKRLLKLADAAGDDELMARFLVGFDRSLRRVKRKVFRYDGSTRQLWTEETLRVPSMTTMPRKDADVRFDEQHDAIVPRYLPPKKIPQSRLFSTATRRYLRRRAWRYFRRLGKSDPKRYVSAIGSALLLYHDDDCRNGIELIDNWGLVHALFHHSSVLQVNASNWGLAEGQSLGNLKPAPAFSDAWKEHGGAALIALIGKSPCRAIRQWAIGMISELDTGAIAGVSLPTVLTWLSHGDAEISQLAVEMLERSTELSRLSTSDWIGLMGRANESVLDRVCQLVRQRVSVHDVPLAEIIRLSCMPPVPMARLGTEWLREKPVIGSSDCQEVLKVAGAECKAMRPTLVKLAMKKIDASGRSTVADSLEFLDSRYADVRTIGWDWVLGAETRRLDPELWQKLLESPYDDVRLKLVDILESIVSGSSTFSLGQLEKRASSRENWARSGRTRVSDRCDPNRVRTLWATVLLNIHRGGKQKPGVIRSIVAMLEAEPEEIDQLLPLLRTALRSVRRGEWRSALAGLVRLIEARPELSSRVQLLVPELIL